MYAMRRYRIFHEAPRQSPRDPCARKAFPMLKGFREFCLKLALIGSTAKNLGLRCISGTNAHSNVKLIENRFNFLSILSDFVFLNTRNMKNASARRWFQTLGSDAARLLFGR
jgi:hypothetical protein